MADKKKKQNQPTQKVSMLEKDTQEVSAKSEPTQLDRIEALLVELVESNRRLHPNISEMLNSGVWH